MLLYNATIDGPYFGVFLFSKGEYKEKAVHVSFIVTFHITSCWAVQVFSVFHHTFMGLCTFMTFLFIYFQKSAVLIEFLNLWSKKKKKSKCWIKDVEHHSSHVTSSYKVYHLPSFAKNVCHVIHPFCLGTHSLYMGTWNIIIMSPCCSPQGYTKPFLNF